MLGADKKEMQPLGMIVAINVLVCLLTFQLYMYVLIYMFFFLILTIFLITLYKNKHPMLVQEFIISLYSYYNVSLYY